MQLIDEGFRQWWKKYSALALAIIAVINVAGATAWTSSPEFQEFLKGLPWGPYALVVANGVVAVFGFLGRFIKQVDTVIDASAPTLKSHALVGLAAIVLAFLMTACSVQPVTPTGAIGGAYDSLRTFNGLVAQTIDRGRITAAQGERVLAESRKVRQVVDNANDALALCGGKLPCDSFEQILSRVQPMLLELERKLREEEAKGTKQ